MSRGNRVETSIMRQNRKGKWGLAALLLLIVLAGSSRWVAAMPKVERMVLPNQLVVLVFEEHSLPFVTFEMLVDAGSWRDPEGLEGLADLTSKVIPLGSLSRTAESLNDRLDTIGSTLSVSSDRDYATFSLQVLKKEFETGFELFHEVLTQPAFPEEEVGREIENALGQIHAAENQPSEVADAAFHKALFAGSPYAHPVRGTSESVRRISREDIVRFYGSFYHPGRSILVIGGDITAEEVRERFAPRLSQWPAGAARDTDVRVEPGGKETILLDRPISQANVVIGHGGVERANPDYYAIQVMNFIMGFGGFSSRLMEEIRVKRGFAYDVSSSFIPRKRTGSFQIVLQTQNGSAREAIEIALREMERMRREPVTEKELKTARDYLIGSFPQRFDSQAEMANFLIQVEYYGLGLDYPEKFPSLIRSVTREDVQRVAREYLHPDRVVTVVVGNLEKVNLTK